MKNRFTLKSAMAGFALVALCALSSITESHAQEEKQFNFSVALNSDQFFGFYPTFQGSYGFSDKAQSPFMVFTGEAVPEQAGATGLSSALEQTSKLEKACRSILKSDSWVETC